MKLIKTEIPGYYYNENKKGITYYYSYKDKSTKQSKRKKIYSCKENNTTNLKYAVSITTEILKGETSKLILEETNDNIDETLNVEHFTLNEIIDLHHTKFYNQKVRELKELFAGVNEKDFNNNAVVKKKLYGVKRRILQYNKNIRKSSIGNMKYKDITKRKINNYLANELNQNLALKTKYNIIVFVRTAINSMIRNDYIKSENVFDKVDIKNDKRQRTRVLSAEEIELFLKECKKWNKPQEVEIFSKDNRKSYKRFRKPNYNIYTAAYLGVITAARSSSVLTIKKKDIDLKNQTITLINHKAKNQKYKIPINEDAIEWFNKKLKFYNDDDYLLQPNTEHTREMVGENNPLTFIPREVFNIMNRLFNEGIDRKVNLERDNMVNYHTIRRSVATNLAIGGVSIYKIKKLLDHKSIDITEHYLNLSYLDYKEDLTIFQNELFKGFKNLIDNNTQEKNENSQLKEKLINSILVMSGNEKNEMLKIALETLSEEELKLKLTTYV